MDQVIDRTTTATFYRAQVLINGEWVDSAGGGIIEVEDPATKKFIGAVPRREAADVDRAVAAPKAAFPPGVACRPVTAAAC